MFRVGDFQIPVDGKLGLSLDRAAGWGARKLASPMFGLVANAEKPILTLFQKRLQKNAFIILNKFGN